MRASDRKHLGINLRLQLTILIETRLGLITCYIRVMPWFFTRPDILPYLQVVLIALWMLADDKKLQGQR